MNRLIRVATSLTITLTLLSASGVAQAEENWVKLTEKALQFIDGLPGDSKTKVLSRLSNARFEQGGSYALSFSYQGRQVNIPRSAVEAILLDLDSGDSIKIGLPFNRQASAATKISSGVVGYQNGNQSVTVPLIRWDGSLQIATILLDSKAPTTFSYPLDMPEGFSLIPDKSGSVSILDENASWVAGVAPAWALDSAGHLLRTSYEVQDNVLVQTIDTTSRTVKYPVIADPWFGIDMIDHSIWDDKLWAFSPTLKIYPTDYGRYHSSSLALSAAWDETLSKTSRKGHPNPDTSAMRVQFDCHYMAVRLRDPEKASWNLDSKLPWIDFWTEVNYGCNYPASSAAFAF